MKRNVWLFVGLTILIAVGIGCQNMSGTSGTAATAPAKSCDKVLAQIGTSNICLSDFQSRLDKIPPFYRKRVATKDGKLEYLNRMVEDELYYLEALSKGVDQDPEVLDQLDQIKKSILSGKIKKDLMEAEITVSDEDVKKYFDENEAEFLSPETVTIRHILFRVKHKATDEEKANQEKKANEVYNLIKGGKLDFQDAAKKYSEDKVSAKKGGELAPIKRGIKSAEFEKEAFGMSKAGEISNLFEDRRGFNILQFAQRTEPEKKEFDEVEARIKRKLQQDGRKTTMEDFSASLRQKNQVTINEDLLVDEGPGEAGPPAGLPQMNMKTDKKVETDAPLPVTDSEKKDE